MSAVLDLPAIRQRATRLSVEDYHRLGELPVELLCGTIIDKMPKSPLHQIYADRLLIAAPEVIESTALPGVRLDLAALFA